MRVVLACLALGVAAIAAVGSLRAAVDRGLATEGARLLGGDIAIDDGAQDLPDSLRSWLQARHGQVSAIVQLRTLLVAPGGDRLLVDLKAVDGAYPLIGGVALEPPMRLAEALQGGVAADPLVLERLRLHPGDIVRIGNTRLALRATLRSEPDHAGGVSLLGPRVLIASAALPATGLIQPGSLLTHEWRVRLPQGADPRAMVAAIRAAFPGTGWRIRTAGEAATGLGQAVQQTSLFLTLVGLSALLVGGIGVATGVRAWLEGRARSIATLRCLGAPARLVFAMVLIQVLLLCGAGILAGVAAGAALPMAGLAAFGRLLPVPAAAGLYPSPLLLAAAYGLLTAGAFALWPLGRAARIPGAALFRDAILPEAGYSRAVLATNLAIGAALAGLLVATSADRPFALYFCLGALLTLALFRAGASAVMAAARMAAARRPAWLRLGLANLYRPAAATPLLLVSLGLGLTTLSAVALIEGNITRPVHRRPASARAKLLLHRHPERRAGTLSRYRGPLRPARRICAPLPSLRARIVLARRRAGGSGRRSRLPAGWALRGDRGLTYSAAIPDGSQVTSGQMVAGRLSRAAPALPRWEGLARGWGLHVGDVPSAPMCLGRDIDFRIANLRAIDWRALTINFTLVAAPGLLEAAPQMHIATLRPQPGR